MVQVVGNSVGSRLKNSVLGRNEDSAIHMSGPMDTASRPTIARLKVARRSPLISTASPTSLVGPAEPEARVDQDYAQQDRKGQHGRSRTLAKLHGLKCVSIGKDRERLRAVTRATAG